MGVARVSRPRIFVTQPIADRAMARLRELGAVTANPNPLHIMTAAELAAAVRGNDVLFCLLHDPVDATVVRANPALKVIASMTITPANIDVAEATRLGIPVTVIPPIVTEATADLTWALLLAVARRVAEADALVKSGAFPGAQSRYLEGRGVSGKTLGLVGAGRVGRAVARRALGFDMRVLYHDPRRVPPADEQALRLEWVTFERVLSEADFVSIHVPLTPATHHLVGAVELARMKPTACLINTARGPIVDERALTRALVEGRLAGAGLDVFEHEPHPTPELLKLANVVLTPHVGSAVGELREQMALVVVDNVAAVLAGRRPPNCANPGVFERPEREVEA
jgi:glyoxylate reductase